ncbi:helix-turn-helix domain-containing protein [Aeromonas piscicola]|uniref:helix-turn-helix domain-containing protein n=1 Tax=Aeromonas piscicola TaxID=600645 RepID=UPI0021F81F62|nr:helix-turn-helix domain-containing protein [Aeromonas piscicola]MCW0507207.1 helix-turn-helix domain-containing protein [Aeromonas piscicola]
MNKKKAAPQNGTTQLEHPKNNTLCAGPTVTGQLAQVLTILRQGPTSSLEFIHEHNILRAPARIFQLRQKGFNITPHIQPHVLYRDHVYRNTAIYVLGQPEWSSPSESDSNTTTS